MVIGLFCRKLREGVDEAEFAAAEQQMWDIVSSSPDFGLVAVSDVDAADGSHYTLAVFRDAAGMAAWWEQADHRATQQLARDEYFEWYWGLGATVEHGYEFDRTSGRRPAVLEGWVPPGFSAVEPPPG